MTNTYYGQFADAPEKPEVHALVARIIIDSLGRRWNPALHPRDSNGRFIETFAEVRGFLTSDPSNKNPDFNGIVEGMDPDGSAVIRVIAASNESLVGRRMRVPYNKLQVVPLKARIGKDNRPHWYEEPASKDAVERLMQEAKDLLSPPNRVKFQSYFDRVRAAEEADSQFLAIRDLIDQLDKAGETESRDKIWDLLDEVRGDEAKANLQRVKDAPERPVDELPEDAIVDGPEKAGEPDGERSDRGDSGEPGDRPGTGEAPVQPGEPDAGTTGDTESPGSALKERITAETEASASITPDELIAISSAGGAVFPLRRLRKTPEAGNIYSDAVNQFKAGSEWGASVTAYTPEEYADMEMWVDPDGHSGFALRDGEIVSVFSDGTYVQSLDWLMHNARKRGGNRLDAFNTVLPNAYGRLGFRPVARIPWNDEFAPDDWDYEKYKEFNGGRPDVYFMAHQPDRTLDNSPEAVPLVNEYDAGLAAAREAVAPEQSAQLPRDVADAAPEEPKQAPAPEPVTPRVDTSPSRDPSRDPSKWYDGSGSGLIGNRRRPSQSAPTPTPAESRPSERAPFFAIEEKLKQAKPGSEVTITVSPSSGGNRAPFPLTFVKQENGSWMLKNASINRDWKNYDWNNYQPGDFDPDKSSAPISFIELARRHGNAVPLVITPPSEVQEPEAIRFDPGIPDAVQPAPAAPTPPSEPPQPPAGILDDLRAPQEVIRGRTRKEGRGQGEVRLRDRRAIDKSGQVIGWGSVVDVPVSRQKNKQSEDGVIRPAFQGVVQNVSKDGKYIKVRDFGEQYRNVNDNENRKTPYYDFKLKAADVDALDLGIDRAEALQQLHAEVDREERRQIRDDAAGRIAPVIGKNMKVPPEWVGPAPTIDQRVAMDANGRMVRKGDWVLLPDGKRGVVARVNSPWDKNWDPRVVVRDDGGGWHAEPHARNVQYLRDPNSDVYLRANDHQGIYVPTPNEAAQVAQKYGLSDELVQAIQSGDGNAIRAAAVKDEKLVDFLEDAEFKRDKFLALVRDGKDTPERVLPYKLHWSDALAIRASLSGIFADEGAVENLRANELPVWEEPTTPPTTSPSAPTPPTPPPTAPPAPAAPETPVPTPTPEPEVPAANARDAGVEQSLVERNELLQRAAFQQANGARQRKDAAGEKRWNNVAGLLQDALDAGFDNPTAAVDAYVKARKEAALTGQGGLRIRRGIDQLRLDFEGYLQNVEAGDFNVPEATPAPEPGAATSEVDTDSVQVAYHGSQKALPDNLQPQVDTQNRQTHGRGLYVTETSAVAEQFGDNVSEVVLPQKRFDLNTEVSERDAADLVSYLRDQGSDSAASLIEARMAPAPEAEDDFGFGPSVARVVAPTWDDLFGMGNDEDSARIGEWLHLRKEADALERTMYALGGDHREYVILHPERMRKDESGRFVLPTESSSQESTSTSAPAPAPTPEPDVVPIGDIQDQVRDAIMSPAESTAAPEPVELFRAIDKNGDEHHFTGTAAEAWRWWNREGAAYVQLMDAEGNQMDSREDTPSPPAPALVNGFDLLPILIGGRVRVRDNADGSALWLNHVAQDIWEITNDDGVYIDTGGFTGEASGVASDVNDWLSANPEVPAEAPSVDLGIADKLRASDVDLNAVLKVLDNAANPVDPAADKLTKRQKGYLLDLMSQVIDRDKLSEHDAGIFDYWVSVINEQELTKRAGGTLIKKLSQLRNMRRPSTPESESDAPPPVAIQPVDPANIAVPGTEDAPVQMDINADGARIPVNTEKDYRRINQAMKQLSAQFAAIKPSTDGPSASALDRIAAVSRMLDAAIAKPAGPRKSAYIDEAAKRLDDAIGEGWTDGLQYLSEFAAWKNKATSLPRPTFTDEQRAAYQQLASLYSNFPRVTSTLSSAGHEIRHDLAELIGLAHPNAQPFAQAHRSLMRKLDDPAVVSTHFPNGLDQQFKDALAGFSPNWSDYQGQFSGHTSRADRNAAMANSLQGLSLKELEKGQLPSGWTAERNDFSKPRSKRANWNGVAILQDDGGNRVIVKYDGDFEDAAGFEKEGKGADAEIEVAALYRAFGFKQPEVIRVNPGATDSAERDLVFMDFAGEEFGLRDVQEVGQLRGQLSAQNFAEPDDILRFVASNAVVMSTDRNGGNAMIGLNENDEHEIIPIDNGLALRNASFGLINNALKRGLDIPDPLKFAQGRVKGARRSYFARGIFGGPGLLQDYIDVYGRDHAIQTLEAWAKKMRDEYAKRQAGTNDPELSSLVMSRIDWIENNATAFVDGMS